MIIETLTHFLSKTKGPESCLCVWGGGEGGWYVWSLFCDAVLSVLSSFSVERAGPEVIKLFSCSTQRSTKFILLINVKMPTIVGILTFISMISTTPEKNKAKHFFICRCLSFYEQLKFCAQLS